MGKSWLDAIKEGMKSVLPDVMKKNTDLTDRLADEIVKHCADTGQSMDMAWSLAEGVACTILRRMPCKYTPEVSNEHFQWCMSVRAHWKNGHDQGDIDYGEYQKEVAAERQR